MLEIKFTGTVEEVKSDLLELVGSFKGLDQVTPKETETAPAMEEEEMNNWKAIKRVCSREDTEICSRVRK